MRSTTWMLGLKAVALAAFALSFVAAAPLSHARARHHSTGSRTFNEPQLRSSQVLVVDKSDATVVYSKRANIAAPIASITKLMTALVVLDGKQPMDQMLTISREDCSLHKGAASRLIVGAELSRRDLLHLALMSSENRAAHALGRNYPGGTVAFVAAMNLKARALGMTHAHFVDPSGLSEENVASPEDLVRLVNAASQRATIREFSTDRRHAVKVGRRMMEYRNTNSLVSNPHWTIHLQKTGFINEAGRCLVMQAVIDGRTVVMVLLDSTGKYTRTADAQRIRLWMESRARASLRAAA